MNTPSISRAPGGYFAKGQSANPAGRPKGIKNKPSLISQLLAELGEFTELEFSLDSIRDGKLVRAERLRYSIHGEQVVFYIIAFRLLALAMGGNIEAIRIILDRTEGKVPPPLNLGGQPGGPDIRVVFYTPEKRPAGVKEWPTTEEDVSAGNLSKD